MVGVMGARAPAGRTVARRSLVDLGLAISRSARNRVSKVVLHRSHTDTKHDIVVVSARPKSFCFQLSGSSPHLDRSFEAVA
jgi:hypothetical protein